MKLTRLFGTLAMLICALPATAQYLLWHSPIKAPVVGSPVVGKDGSVYVGCTDGYLRAYDSAGRPTWEFKLQKVASGQFALQKDVLYVPTMETTLQAVHISGNGRWEFSLEPHITGAPAVSEGGDILFTAADDNLYCLGPSGGLRWKAPLSGTVAQGPAISRDGEIVVGRKGAIIAFTPEGQRLWKYDTPSNLSTPISIGPSGAILAQGADGVLRCLNPDGTLSWSVEVKAEKFPPLVTETEVFVVGETAVYSYSLETGSSNWDKSVTVTGCPALGADGILYVPTKGTGQAAESSDQGTGPERGETAATMATYSITGTIKLDTSGLPGVTVSAGDVSTTTASGGTYTLTGMENGTYTVTPSKSGYSFSPTSLSVTINNGDQTGKDFTATAASTFSISGTITFNGSGLAGVEVSTTGTSAVTGSSGKYKLTGLANGTYTVTPLKAGYHFTPTTLSVTISSADVEGKDFTATTPAGNIKLLDTLNDGEVLPTGLNTEAGSGDIALYGTGETGRVVVINFVPELYCFSVGAGNMGEAWSQAGAGPRRQSRSDAPPTVTLSGLTGGETYRGTVSVEAVPEDTNLSGLTCRLSVNGSILSTLSEQPFVFSWYTNGTPDGAADVGVEAIDLAGNSAFDSVSVVVSNGASAPLAFYAVEQPQTFIWNAPASETRFKVECAEDEEFADRVANSVKDRGKWLSAPFWTPSKDAWKHILSIAKNTAGEDATGYWRVSGKNSGSFFFSTYIVKAQEPAQPTGPPDGFAIPSGARPTFTWTASYNKFFRIEFSDREDFASGVIADSSTPDRPWLKGGSWMPSKKKWKKISSIGETVYWRVTAKDYIGRINDGSPIYSFTIE